MLNIIGMNDGHEWEFLAACDPEDLFTYETLLEAALIHFERVKVLDDSLKVIVAYPTMH